jgi:hypothetical protein
MDKHQIPSTKFQISSNHRTSKSQTRLFWSFEIGASNLFGIWNLGFGIWNELLKSVSKPATFFGIKEVDSERWTLFLNAPIA